MSMPSLGLFSHLHFAVFRFQPKGRITTIPDVAQFSFSVKTEGGKNIADLQKENTEKTNQSIEFVKANGVETKDIKTTNYSLEPRYQYYNCSRPENNATPCPAAGYCRLHHQPNNFGENKRFQKNWRCARGCRPKRRQ